ncbi:golgin subfamily A member 1 isoform X5 [Peromyscus maniculatus bairdii]|uniref:golgin subfamily A member 1 isoform X5 n=1 Tax=Peromyscus maniculatus bairdii TaxID=230844 RepID=UPI001C2E5365|nr:golgin subfamily A member 1 isoform X4 [Peromyscus maniculatus bairdii]
MFAKLKKKIAEETAVAQRPAGSTRIPRSVSKESVASMGADSGDDFASDGSSSREDLSSQLLRRNEQIRKLEARLSDYAEQVRNLQKIKEKLEIALEKHQDSSMRKFQEQNETFQANRAKMAEGLALALARKDQEWSEKMDQLEKDKRFLTTQLQEMKNQSLSLFQKRDEIDELEGFQQQEISKVKHMLLKKEECLGEMEQELEARTRELNRAQEELMTSNQISSGLNQQLEELQRHCSTLEEQRDRVTSSKACAEHKIVVLEHKEQELQAFIQQLSIDLQKVTAETQEKEKIIAHLQEKVISLEKRLEQNLSGEDHIHELLKERTIVEQNLEDTRQQLLAARSSHTKAIDLLETRVKDLEQSLQATEEQLSQSRDVVAAQEAQIQKLITTNQESSLSQQQVLALEQHCRERTHALEAQIEALEQTRVADQIASEQGMQQLQRENVALKESKNECERSLQHHQFELKKLKDEWSQREIVSVAMAQALEEVRKQREEFQQQAAQLTAIIEEKNRSLCEKDKVLLQKEQELHQLEKDHDSALLQMHQLQSEVEALRSCRAQEAVQTARGEDPLQLQGQEPLVIAKAMQDSEYELQVSEGTPNGEVEAMDLEQLQKEKQDLEQQLTEKNKIMKQMQQRMLELKKTLQKELAFHLIKAVSVLLNFSQEEENMLKETLEYKMSWFGSKPAPKGSIRPSISNPRIPWS